MRFEFNGCDKDSIYYYYDIPFFSRPIEAWQLDRYPLENILFFDSNFGKEFDNLSGETVHLFSAGNSAP